jgi:hypothetical protein
MSLRIELKPFQYDFLYSKARHPAFVGGWNTGKTLNAIGRARIYSKLIPNNLGVIFRKTFRSLQDSTMKDFEKYTSLKIDCNRNLVDPNGSITMFRHIDELQSINQQNINLGWFYIEQGEELDDNEPFFMLFGRLRRVLEPTEEFKKLGLSLRSGWVIGNAGENWMKPLWKDGKLEEAKKLIDPPYEGLFSQLIEATTWDNAEHAPPDFLSSLKILEVENPQLYRQFVLNDWGVSVRNKVFVEALFKIMKERYGFLAQHSYNAGVAVDPAGEGADMNVFMAGNGGEVVDCYERLIASPSEKAIRAVELCKRINGFFIIVDCDGLGIETYSELTNLDKDFLKGIQIIKFHGSEPSDMLLLNRRMYENKRAEAAFVAQKRGWAGLAAVNEKDKKLVEELEADEYFTNNRGFIQIIPKKDIKERLKRSPGRADCWKMLQWAFEQNYEDKTYRDEVDAYPHQQVSDDSVYAGVTSGHPTPQPRFQSGDGV